MNSDESTVIKLQDNEVLRVTAEGEFIWNENADDMIASGDYSHYPALRHILKALRENERLRDAVAAEREACAKLCEEKLSYFTPIPCPDGISGCLVDHHGPVQRKKTATECAAAIRARGE
jgi:NADPH-dependent ferric siderophore reductase